MKLQKNVLRRIACGLCLVGVELLIIANASVYITTFFLLLYGILLIPQQMTEGWQPDAADNGGRVYAGSQNPPLPVRDRYCH